MKWRALFWVRRTRSDRKDGLELSGVVAVLRHQARASQAWDRGVFLFPQSWVLLGALQEGRSSAKDILRLCRTGAIIQMVCQTWGYRKWVELCCEVRTLLRDLEARGLSRWARETEARR